MKIILPIAFILSFSAVSNAQSTAQDWTLTDCSSSPHTLFNYLDNEEVVIMEFAMGCGSCTYAAGHILDIRDQFNAIYPGKVKAFYMDYWSGHTCANVSSVVPAYPFDAGFAGTDVMTEKNYYLSGSPMPAIVIVAGSNHLVIYEKSNFADADTTNIYNAIDNFFNTVGVTNVAKTENSAIIFPNPSNGKISVEINWNVNETGTLSFYDYTGKEICPSQNYLLVPGKQQLPISISDFPNGNYILKIQSPTHIMNVPLTIKQ